MRAVVPRGAPRETYEAKAKGECLGCVGRSSESWKATVGLAINAALPVFSFGTHRNEDLHINIISTSGSRPFLLKLVIPSFLY